MNEINLKDFQFSDEELKNMSEGDKVKLIEKIDSAITQTKANATYYSAYQLALKLVLNGSYGAFAHPKFSVSNKYIANSITIHGRDIILYMLSKIEDYFFNQWHLDTNAHLLMSDTFVAFDSENNAYMLTYLNEIVSGRKYDKGDKDSGLQSLMKDWNLTPERLTEIPSEKIKIIFKDKEIELEKRYKRHLADFTKINSIDSSIIEERDNMEGYKTYYHKEDIIQYGDTDSSSCESIIYTDNGVYTIEELYNKNIINGSAGETIKGHESVKCSDKVLNWDKKLYFADVKRIIRHKVTKEKWKLKTKKGKEIIVTNDHSMIVFRNGQKIEIKPKDILKSDKILIINNNIVVDETIDKIKKYENE